MSGTTTHVTCAKGHSTTVRATIIDGQYRSVEDLDWRNQSGDGAPIRCPCGAPTAEVYVSQPMRPVAPISEDP